MNIDPQASVLQKSLIAQQAANPQVNVPKPGARFSSGRLIDQLPVGQGPRPPSDASRSPSVRQFIEGVGMVHVVNLKDHPDRAAVTKQAAVWLANEFCQVDDRYAKKNDAGELILKDGHAQPDPKGVEKLLHERMDNPRFPEAALAAISEQGKLLGTASFVEYDNPQFQAKTGHDPQAFLKVWLADLYVAQDQRGQGIGTVLLKAIEAVAGQAGHAGIHLYTEDQQAFYGNRGWGVLRQDSAGGEPVTIMSKPLGTLANA